MCARHTEITKVPTSMTVARYGVTVAIGAHGMALWKEGPPPAEAAEAVTDVRLRRPTLKGTMRPGATPEMVSFGPYRDTIFIIFVEHLSYVFGWQRNYSKRCSLGYTPRETLSFCCHYTHCVRTGCDRSSRCTNVSISVECLRSVGTHPFPCSVL